MTLTTSPARSPGRLGRAALSSLLALFASSIASGCAETSDADLDDVTATDSFELTNPAQRRARSEIIREASRGMGLTNGALLAGIAQVETGLSHCWSEATWACQGPASASCGGGPVIAGASDGPCSAQQGGLGMFQFDAGTYAQTLARDGRAILEVDGNVRRAVQFVTRIVREEVDGIRTNAQALAWLNAVPVQPGHAAFERWTAILACRYNGRCGSADQQAKYRNATVNLAREFGGEFWREGGGGGTGPTMDVTGDGHGDLVMHAQSDTGAGELWIWQGYRDGFWETPKLPFQNSAFMANAKIAVTDVTGDGAADIVLVRANGDSSDIHLIRGGANPTGTGTFVRNFGRRLDDLQLAAGDVTGDGHGDLVIHARSETGAGELWVFQGYDGGFWDTPKLPFQNSAFMANAKIAVTDVTGDGAAEILLARSSEGGSDLHMIRGGANPTGTGTFIRTFGRPLDAIQLAGGDVTGDGNGDLVIHARSETSAGELWIFQGYDGGFWATPKLPFQNSAFMADAKLAVTDVTGDGAEDVLLVRATETGSDIHMLRGSANPTGLGAFLRSFGRPLERIELP